MNLDSDLRNSMRSHADDAPQANGLLDSVLKRSHQITRRRRRTATGFAVLAVASAIAVPSLVKLGGSGAPDLAAEPKPVASTTSPSGAAAGVQLASIDMQLPVFPYQPTYLPLEDMSWHVTVNVPGLGLLLEHEDTPGQLLLTFGNEPYPWDWEPLETETIKINGLDATLRRSTSLNGKPMVGITWQRGGGWLTVQSHEMFDEAQTRRIAEGIINQPSGGRVPLEFTIAPVGFELSSLGHDFMCLSAGGRRLQYEQEGVCANLSAVDQPLPGATALTVTGWPAELNMTQHELRIHYGEDGMLRIYWRADLPLSQADVIRIAEGITLPDA